MESARTVRAAFVFVLALSAAGLAYGYAVGSAETTLEGHVGPDGVDSDAQIAPPSDGVTVVATDSNSWRGKESEGPRARAELVAVGPDGTARYYNDSHTRYWDVDPVSGTEMTVEYMFADHLNSSACPSEWDLAKRDVDREVWNRYTESRSTDACTRNGYERVNLTTGEVTRLWTRVTPGKESTRYHDADRINETHLAVADIFLDRVMVVDTSSGETVSSWSARDAFSPESGGPYPEDWTHINDVEVLPDGRLMVSVRNHDSVIFIDRTAAGDSTGGPGNSSMALEESWTLGDDGEHDVLYEQHNPDYVPRARGGPAAIVADSENNRVVEYRRGDGEWRRTWVWRDARLQWPRDADRLPNDHTLVTDSNGNRVFEVDETGSVVWSLNVAFPYEAERLGTGDESANGSSAPAANLGSRTAGLDERLLIFTKQFLPGKYLNGLMYVTPVWMGLAEVIELTVLLVGGLAWGALLLGRTVSRSLNRGDETPE
jgi:hypothetical protein